MRNTKNTVVVRYPNKAIRVRNCQTSVYPSKEDMRPVRNINDWFEYIRFITDAQYGADAAIDATIAAGKLINDANKILKQSAV